MLEPTCLTDTGVKVIRQALRKICEAGVTATLDDRLNLFVEAMASFVRSFDASKKKVEPADRTSFVEIIRINSRVTDNPKQNRLIHAALLLVENHFVFRYLSYDKTIRRIRCFPPITTIRPNRIEERQFRFIFQCDDAEIARVMHAIDVMLGTNDYLTNFFLDYVHPPWSYVHAQATNSLQVVQSGMTQIHNAMNTIVWPAPATEQRSSVSSRKKSDPRCHRCESVKPPPATPSPTTPENPPGAPKPPEEKPSILEIERLHFNATQGLSGAEQLCHDFLGQKKKWSADEAASILMAATLQIDIGEDPSTSEEGYWILPLTVRPEEEGEEEEYWGPIPLDEKACPITPAFLYGIIADKKYCLNPEIGMEYLSIWIGAHDANWWMNHPSNATQAPLKSNGMKKGK